jgi:hypothetical protein
LVNEYKKAGSGLDTADGISFDWRPGSLPILISQGSFEKLLRPCSPKNERSPGSTEIKEPAPNPKGFTILQRQLPVYVHF